MNTTKYKYRQVARFTIEAATPLAVGSGDINIVTDAPVARDVNGLPYIPGTAMAGVLRHSLNSKGYANALFGYQRGASGQGSTLIISDAIMVGHDGKAVDGLCDISADPYLAHFKALPIRQHVCINEMGSAVRHGKFDEEVVYAGTRFCFDVEIMATDDSDTMRDIINTISSPTFRIGSGTRNGFGSMKVVKVQYKAFNLSDSDELEAYLSRPASLAEAWDAPTVSGGESAAPSEWIKYTLHLKPRDFFLFSSGFGDDDADLTPVKEQKVTWDDKGKPSLSEEEFLIPATSVKGAIAHRTVYHWNRLNQRFADKGNALDCDKCPAIADIFGTVTDDANAGMIPQRGHAIFSDVTISNKCTDEKVVYHIRTDKFSGGVIDGALFQEKTVIAHDKEIVEEIHVSKEAFAADATARESFEKALNDICLGLLPLGGGTNRGNGTFTGTLTVEE